MNQINEKQYYYLLSMSGFTMAEIWRISRLRQCYMENPLDQAPLDHARLAFVRWLVQTGRLTDQDTPSGAPCYLDKGYANLSYTPQTALDEEWMPSFTRRTGKREQYYFFFTLILSFCKVMAFEMGRPAIESCYEDEPSPVVRRTKRRFSPTMLVESHSNQ